MQRPGAGQTAWLQLRPAVPRRFSGNNPSRRRRNTEPGQWVSSWLHSLCSVYQPLRAPEAEAGSRQRAPQLQSARRSWSPQDPRSTLSQPQPRSAEGLPPWSPSRGTTSLPPAICIESSKLNPKSSCGGLKPTRPRPLVAGNAVLCSQLPLQPHAHPLVLPLPSRPLSLCRGRPLAGQAHRSAATRGPAQLGTGWPTQKVSPAQTGRPGSQAWRGRRTAASVS